jgi:hypothetical protein
MDNFVELSGYDRTKSALVTHGAGPVLLHSEKIPTGTNLRITHFGNDVGDIGAWTDNGGVSWTLKINGVPCSFINGEVNQLGTTNQPRELGDPIMVRGGDVVEVYGTNPSAATDYTMLVSVKGKYGYLRR